MNAFPPVDKLDGKRTAYGSLREFEAVQLNMMGVFDQHLQLDQARHAKSNFFAKTAATAQLF